MLKASWAGACGQRPEMQRVDQRLDGGQGGRVRRFVSGQVVAMGAAAAIMTELLWIRALERILGSTALSVAATSGAFFCAMGLGSVVARRALRQGWSPVKLVASLQLAAALWAMLAPQIGTALTSGADRVLWSPAQAGFIAFHYLVAAVALLLPGVVAGALVPLVAEVANVGRHPGKVVAWLWVWDASASVAAALVTGLFLLRSVGASGCCWIAGGIHVAASLLSLRLASLDRGRAKPRRRQEGASREVAAKKKGARSDPPSLILAQLAVAGFAGLGWQALWSRLLALALPGSLLWPSIMLASWIGGSGVGALLYYRLPSVRRHPWVTVAMGQLLSAAGALVGSALGAWLREQLVSARPITSAALAEVALCVAVTLPAAVALGVILPAAIDLFLQGVEESAGRVTGLALAVDLAGAAGATLLVPLIMIPRLGLSGSLLLLAGVQAVAGFSLVLRKKRKSRPSRALGAAVLLLLLSGWLVLHSDLSPWEPDDRREPVRVVWGPMATAAVVREGGGALRLYVDRHHGMGGERGVFIERRQGHIPLLLHGNPRTVLVVGVGTGNTLGAVARHGVERVDAAESLGSVLTMIDLFGETNRRIWRDERVTLHHVDGQALLRRATERYDVIIGDLVHPWRSGATGLFAQEHLQLARSRLAPGGLFCFWLPLHELSDDDLSMVVSTFLETFGDGTAILGHLGWRQPIMALIGGGPDHLLRRERLRPILEQSARDFATEVDLDQPEDLQSLYLGGSDWMRALARDSAVTTWDRPELAYRSASTWWMGTEGLGQRTLAHVMELRRPVDEVAPEDENASRRHRAVGTLIQAELAEADGNFDDASRGYREAALEDPTFRLPRIALELLERR